MSRPRSASHALPGAPARLSSGVFSPGASWMETVNTNGTLASHFRSTCDGLGLPRPDVDALVEFCFSRKISSDAFKVLYRGLILQLEQKDSILGRRESEKAAEEDKGHSSQSVQRRISLPVVTREPSGNLTVKAPVLALSQSRKRYYRTLGLGNGAAAVSAASIPRSKYVGRTITGNSGGQAVTGDADDSTSDTSELGTGDPVEYSGSTRVSVDLSALAADEPASATDSGSVESLTDTPAVASPQSRLRPRSASHFGSFPDFASTVATSTAVDVFINCADDVFRQSTGDALSADAETGVAVGGLWFGSPAASDMAPAVPVFAALPPPPPLDAEAHRLRSVTEETSETDKEKDRGTDATPQEREEAEGEAEAEGGTAFASAPAPPPPLSCAMPPPPVPLAGRRVVPQRLDSDRRRRVHFTWDGLRVNIAASLEAMAPLETKPAPADALDGPSEGFATTSGAQGTVGSAAGLGLSLSERLQKIWGGDVSLASPALPALTSSAAVLAAMPPLSLSLEEPLAAVGADEPYSEGKTQADIARSFIDRGQYEDAVPFLQKAAQLLATEALPAGSGSTPRVGGTPRLSRVRSSFATAGSKLRDTFAESASPLLHPSPALRKQAIADDRTRYRVQVAKSLVKCGKSAEAVPIFLQILWEEQRNPEVLWALATHYLREGLVDMAATHISTLRMLFPNCPDVLLAECRCFIFGNDLIAAIKLLSSAIDSESLLVSTSTVPGPSACDCAALHDCVPHASLCDVYMLLGELFALTNHHRKAVGCFEAARRLVPCGWPLAVVYEAVSLASAAEAWLPKSLDRLAHLKKDIQACESAGITVTPEAFALPAMRSFPQAMKIVFAPGMAGPCSFPNPSYMLAMKAVVTRCTLRVCQVLAVSSDPMCCLAPLLELLQQCDGSSGSGSSGGGGEGGSGSGASGTSVGNALSAAVNYELKAFVLEVLGVVHYRLNDLGSAQAFLEQCLDIATGHVPPTEAPAASATPTPVAAGNAEWNHDGRYTAVASEPSDGRPPVLNIGMPVGSYFLSAVYSCIHKQLRRQHEQARRKRGADPGLDSEEAAARKVWSNAAMVLLRQAMDEGWGHLIAAEVDTAAELWRLNWVDVELRQIAAWS